MAYANGKKSGGRVKGSVNKAKLAREELARAQIAESLAKAKASGHAEPKVALNELYKALAIAEGVAGRLQPTVIEQDANGKVTVKGGDLKGFGEWFDRYKDCISILIKYQQPMLKAIEAPTPPPDPADVERRSRKRFGLRVFEGGRQVQPLSRDIPDEDDA